MFSLKPRQELRIETTQDVVLKVLNGSIEIFGREIANNVDLSLKKGLNLGLFSWQGAQVEISGPLGSDYIADETPMVSYLNVFLALEQMKEYALPRVMIVGGADAGKSTLSKILTNYLTKQGKEVMFVDTDPNKMSLSLNGSIGVTCVKQCLDIEQGWGAAQSLLGNIPLVYYYGYSKISEFKEYYEKLLGALSQVVDQKINKASDLRALLINTPPEFTDSSSGFELLCNSMELFSVNVVLVIGHERLYSNLLKKTKKDVQVVKLVKSGGVVHRDAEYRKQAVFSRVKEYFYGLPGKHDLAPFSITISFNDVLVRVANKGSIVPSSALPLGMEALTKGTVFKKVEVGDILLHSVLAISSAMPPSGTVWNAEQEAEALITSPIVGFIYVAEVDEAKRKMTVLSPAPGKLPYVYLIMGNLKWMDT